MLMTPQCPGSPTEPRAPHLDSTHAPLSASPPGESGEWGGVGTCRRWPRARGLLEPLGAPGAGAMELSGEREGREMMGWWERWGENSGGGTPGI